MSDFNAKNLNELIRKIAMGVDTPQSDFISRKSIEQQLQQLILEPQSHIDLAKKSLNILSTRATALNDKGHNLDHVNDPNTYYYLKYFMQQTSASEAELLADKRLFENRAIMRYLNLREPRTQRNIWEALAQLKHPGINQLLVSHAAHIEIDCPNSPGDLYSTAYQYQNYDLIEQLIDKKVIPQKTHRNTKHVLTTAIKQNNQKVFIQLFNFLQEQKAVGDLNFILNEVFKKNAFNIYEYLSKSQADVFIKSVNSLHSDKNDKTDKLMGVLELARHKNAKLFKSIISNPAVVLHFPAQPEKITKLCQTYFAHEIVQFKNDPGKLSETSAQTLFERFDLKNLVVRSFLAQEVINFTKTHLHPENLVFFNQFLDNFLKALNNSVLATENQQVLLSKEKGLYSFSQTLMFETEMAKYNPSFFEKKELSFFHDTQAYNAVISVRSQLQYEEQLNCAPEYIQDFFNHNTVYAQHKNDHAVFLTPVPPEPAKWTLPTNDKLKIHPFMTYPQFLEYTSRETSAEQKSRWEKYSNVSIIIERRNLQEAIEHSDKAPTSKSTFKL